MDRLSRGAGSGHRHRLLGLLLAALGVLALLVPLWPAFAPAWRLGMLLVAAAVLEIFHGFRRATSAGRRSAWTGGAITAGMGLLVMSAPVIVGVGALVAVWFAVEGARYALRAMRAWGGGQGLGWDAAASAGNFAVFGVLALLGTKGVLWTLTVAAALRIFGTAANVLRAEVRTSADAAETALRDLGLPEDPRLIALRDRLEAEELSRGPVDRAWVGVFVLTLLAIYLGRMGLDRTSLGLVSPVFAVLGDLVVALGIAYAVVVPAELALRTLARPVASRAWAWCLAVPETDSDRDWRRRLLWRWLAFRLRRAIRIKQASYSLPNAIGRGLQIGLPAAAIIAATTPIWGMSWYFDTENYASSIWDSWAEARTDDWREAMIRALTAEEAAAGRPAPAFEVHPPGLGAQGDFAFVVIGDTGEGDASQHVLHDQLILATLQPDVRFVVLSSDVV